ncbi:MAG: response regulator transcription factor [Dehalococcoidia bacterium]|nr:response regulator transcription factor [Dehalococcoidia bacterium]
MTTIVLADDHDIVRRGLQSVLQAQKDFEIIGEASDGLETIKIAEKLQPDVLVLDLVMPGLSGLEVARRVAKQSPKTRVIILSMYDNEAGVLEAFRAGAMAYVVKQALSNELVQAIRAVMEGRLYLSPPLSDRAIASYVEKAQGAKLDLYETILTSREREVLQLTAEGYTSIQIGQRLSISPRTVDTHRNSAMRKLDLHSSADIVRYAIQRGIVPLES